MEITTIGLIECSQSADAGRVAIIKGKSERDTPIVERKSSAHTLNSHTNNTYTHTFEA